MLSRWLELPFVRYALAVAAGLALLLVGFAQQGAMHGVDFSISLAVIALVTLLLGAGPGLLITIIVGLGAWFLVQEPQASFALENQRQIARVVTFFIAAFALALAVKRLERTQGRLLAAKRDAERLLAEQRETAERLHALSESMPQFVFVLRPDGSTEYVNKRFTQFTGLDAGAVNREGWGAFFHPDDLPLAHLRWAEATRTGEPRTAEIRYRARDGSYRWHLISITPLHAVGGRSGRWMGTVTDIHDRKIAEEALREAERRQREVLEAIPQLVWTSNADGSCDYVSKQWADYTGFAVEEQLALGWLDRLDPDDRPAIAEAWKRAVASGGPFDACARIAVASGGYRWFRARAVPLRDRAGHIVKWFGTWTDVDEQIRAEKAIREEDSRKNEFLAVLSHELRNPLAPIRNCLYVLGRVDPGGDQARRAHAVIERQVRHLTRLIDDLLDLTRISQGKIRLRREILELGGLARRCAEDHRQAFAENGIELELSVDEEPLYVNGDPIRLEQVVGNLLQNSAKFTPRGGRTVLSVRRTDVKAAAVSVEDTGVGISPEVLPRLFEPFVQAEKTLERSRGGLGLGLSLVKGLVEQHGGRVIASSRGVGAGAEFVVKLPLVDSAAPGPTPIPSGQRRTGAEAGETRAGR